MPPDIDDGGARGAPLLLRAARAGDAATIARLQAGNWQRIYRGLLSDRYLDDECPLERLALWSARLAAADERQHLDVAVLNHATVGFCCTYAQHDPQWGHYFNHLHVTPTAQGQGIGTALLARAAHTCLTTSGDAPAYLWVAATNTAAQHFYRHLGAQSQGVTVWQPPGGGDVALRRFVWASVRALLAHCGSGFSRDSKQSSSAATHRG